MNFYWVSIFWWNIKYRFGKITLDLKSIDFSVKSPTANNDEDIEESKSVSVWNKFTIRIDVINKTILRYFKKFYTAEFKQVLDISKCKSSTLTVQKLLSKAKEYISLKFGDENTTNMHVFIAALVDSKHKFKNSDCVYIKLK